MTIFRWDSSSLFVFLAKGGAEKGLQQTHSRRGDTNLRDKQGEEGRNWLLMTIQSTISAFFPFIYIDWIHLYQERSADFEDEKVFYRRRRTPFNC